MTEFIPYMRHTGIEQAVENWNECHDNKIKFYHGAVRYVLVADTFVVKWDYNKKASKCFGGCYDEYQIYKQVRQGLYGYLFAPITPITVKRRTYYAMPCIKTLGIDVEDELDYLLAEDEQDYIYNVMQIADLHYENWGMDGGYPILIDYACRMCGE